MKQAIIKQIRVSEAEYKLVVNSNEMTEWSKQQRIQELTEILLHLRQTLVDIIETELTFEAQNDKPKLRLVA